MADEYLAVIKASYDYSPQSDDEVAIQENQLLFLIERVDEDWWKVKVKGESQEEDTPVGLVPAAYVEPADHTSVVKALYNYDANAPGELSVKEDELLFVFDTEDEWLLVQSQAEGGKAGFVPGNYVEAAGEDGEDQSTSVPELSSIVVPSSPPPPASNYQDPADRVASTSTKVKADSIQTWSVSEVDKKGKKKKGTLGVGNGSVFFASESDKTPVQKWQTSDIDRVNIEKSKHVHIAVVGAAPASLHFQAGSKDNAEAIVDKLRSSKALSTQAHSSSPDFTDTARPPPIRTDAVDHERARKSGASVHFSELSPVIIPPREASEGERSESLQMENGDDRLGSATGAATALYDFHADGEDELSVKEGERLYVLEMDGDEWWKCQNADGAEGVVPASYLELTATDSELEPAAPADDESEAAEAVQEDDNQEELDRLAAERAEKDRLAKERATKEKAAKERADKVRAEQERKRTESHARAQAATAADRRADANIRPKGTEKPASSQPPSTENNKISSDSSKNGRTSTDGNRPAPEQTRIWHDRSGQFRVEAAFLGFHGGKLRLHKVNGVVVEVPSEKMSLEDMRYVEKLTRKKSSAKVAPGPSEDDEPLATRRKSLRSESSRGTTTRASQSTKSPKVDWFEFFLSAGCDVDDCTRYASSFERDKIDESILPDITDSTMRSLGLREGDIIRVTKVIEKRKARDKKAGASRQDHDEEYAEQLQAEANESNNSTRKQNSTSPAPNLFAGPGGALKNNAPRRGRPQPSKTLLPATVDLNAITTASDQIQRSSSPLAASGISNSPLSPSPKPSAQKPNSAPVASGFDDDAWANRPSSTRPLAPTPPVATPRAPSAPPKTSSSQQQLVSEKQPKGLAKTTEADIFDQLSRLSQLNANKPSSSPASTPASLALTPPVMPPPASFQSGLGMGSSPVPVGQHLQNQQMGYLQAPQQTNGPRGPFAPVPANQSLLQPLIPTNTGFNSFVPTRPNNLAPSLGNQPSFPPFLGKQVSPPPPPQSLMSQPTGSPFGGFGPGNSFPNNGFSPVLAQQTGFGPTLGLQSFDNGMAPPPLPSSVPDATSPANIFAQMKSGVLIPPVTDSPSNNTSPANVFAQMKSGTFASGNDSANPQPSGKYDALRPNPLTAQATGWGYQGVNFQSGYQR